MQLAGKRAIVCASRTGLGRACAEALAAEGVHVVINGRDSARLEATAAEMRKNAVGSVTLAVGDVTTKEGREAVLAACPDPDILINNNGGPPPKSFDAIEPEEWVKALDANMIAALSLIRAVLPAMKERKFGRIINITSAMVTAPSAHMGLSAGARAGLTAASKALSKDVAKYNITVNNLLPERFDTDRQVFMAQQAMKRENISWDEARKRQRERGPMNRLGFPEEFGATCAFYCSPLAGYMSGQNVHLDGGSYPALV